MLENQKSGECPCSVKRSTLVGLEILGLALVAVMLWGYLALHYSLKPYSDPQIWYLFAKDFPHEFGTTGRAYGFPLLLYLASFVAGPFWAFLVNIPVLCGMVVMLYLLARTCGGYVFRQQPVWGAVCGAIAVCILVRIDLSMLLYLANPYRDPLAFLLLMASMICLVSFAYREPRRLPLVAASAVLLALGIATRDTTVLMGLPYLTFMVAMRYRDRTLPFWKAALVGGVAFAVMFVPQAWQNHLVSGHFIIPAQAAEVAQAEGSLTPGVQEAFFTETFPGTLDFLQRHYGWGLIALFIIGLASSLGTRGLVVSVLLLPGILVYFFFYAGYKTVMPRYLLVIDVLAIPVMAAGASWLLGRCVKALRTGPRAEIRVHILSIIALGVSAALIVFQGHTKLDERFKMEHVFKLRRDLDALVPEKALILGDRPLAEIVRCFSTREGAVLDYISPIRTLADPAYFTHLRERAGSGCPIYLLCKKDQYAGFMRRQKDVTLVRAFEAEEYGLGDVLNRNSFSLYRLEDRTNLVCRATVPVEQDGPHVLAVDTEELSSLTNRQKAALLLDGRLLDGHPTDGRNYYQVNVRPGGQALEVRLESDQPVPAILDATAVGLDDFVFELALVTEKDVDLYHINRFGGDFLLWPWPRTRYMGIETNGTVVVPAMAPGPDVCFATRMTAGIASDQPDNESPFRLQAGEKVVYENTLRAHGGEFNGSWRDIGFMFTPESVVHDAATLRFLAGPYKAGNLHESQVMVKRLCVKRLKLADRIDITFGTAGDEWFIMDGMYPAERNASPNAQSWRWTEARARVIVPLAGKGAKVGLAVRYLLEGRPPTLAMPVPEFRWNDHALSGVSSTGTLGSVHFADVRFDVPGDRPGQQINILEISASTWVPREHGLGKDGRILGIMLQSVSAIRQ